MSRKLRPEPKLSVAKRQPPRWQRERNIALVVWILIPLTIALVLGLVGYWVYDTYVAAWHQPVAQINKTVLGNETGNQTIIGNETIVRMDYYVKMLRFYSAIQGDNVDTTYLPYQTLRQIESDELTRRAASNAGIQVSSDELGNATDTYILRLTRGNATQPEALKKLYQQVLDVVRLSEGELRHVVEANLLREKLTEYFKEQKVPKEAEQVYLWDILVDTEGNATEVRDRLLNGEDFATLAKELSLDEISREYGGDLGWVPRDLLYPQIIPYSEIDDVAFSLEIGNISQPIETSKGYYILKISDKAENMQIYDGYRDILTANELESWFNELRAASNIKEYLDQSKINWAMERIQ